MTAAERAREWAGFAKHETGSLTYDERVRMDAYLAGARWALAEAARVCREEAARLDSEETGATARALGQRYSALILRQQAARIEALAGEGR